MKRELLKLIVRPILVERDDAGEIVGECVGEPVPLYTRAQIVEYLDGLDAELQAEHDKP